MTAVSFISLGVLHVLFFFSFYHSFQIIEYLVCKQKMFIPIKHWQWWSMSSVPYFHQSCNQLPSDSPLHLLGKQRWASDFLEVSIIWEQTAVVFLTVRLSQEDCWWKRRKIIGYLIGTKASSFWSTYSLVLTENKPEHLQSCRKQCLRGHLSRMTNTCFGKTEFWKKSKKGRDTQQYTWLTQHSYRSYWWQMSNFEQ